ncbi:hypothetical protein SKAU_G00327840 [Synaphobranchus kaupii]|uniref:Uncharacterized protein n=1 Tax=Synaphobranchus kaupii TaxID=118154 RepID=A0A9Q1IKF5_SYNKA|nr:hypothetical protein SKAU_G00327840 [Synaphobranchus kaupii]
MEAGSRLPRDSGGVRICARDTGFQSEGRQGQEPSNPAFGWLRKRISNSTLIIRSGDRLGPPLCLTWIQTAPTPTPTLTTLKNKLGHSGAKAQYGATWPRF